MADVTATAHVFPSANDLEGGQPNGWGETLFEKNMSSFWLATLGVNNFTFSGAVLPASDADLTMQIPTGKFWLDGHFVEIAATNITFPASSTSFIFAKLLKDVNGNVSSVAYEHNTTGTAPADATPIGTAVTDADNVTSTTDLRLLGPHGVIAITSGTSWTVPAGIFRVFAEVFGGGGGGGGGGAGLTNVHGGAGGAGGTTTFDTLSTTGGAGGGGGPYSGSSGSGSGGAAHAGGSGGTINRLGGGSTGGNAGGGGASGVSSGSGAAGACGGNGGYAASFLAVSPGTTITIAVGSAGGGGSAGGNGGAGSAGAAGIILLHY